MDCLFELSRQMVDDEMDQVGNGHTDKSHDNGPGQVYSVSYIVADDAIHTKTQDSKDQQDETVKVTQSFFAFGMTEDVHEEEAVHIDQNNQRQSIA